MNVSKRPEKGHYIPPGRRGKLGTAAPGSAAPIAQNTTAAATAPESRVSQPSAPPPPTAPRPQPFQAQSSLSAAIHSRALPVSSTANTSTFPSTTFPNLLPLPRKRFDPSTLPRSDSTNNNLNSSTNFNNSTLNASTLTNPTTDNIASEAMRSNPNSPHSRLPPSRNNSYEIPLTGVRRIEVRDHTQLRSDDPFYRGDKAAFGSTRLAANVASGKYGAPPHITTRDRIYEDRYNEPARAQPGWIPGGKPQSPLMAHPVRILRNPERERERERENAMRGMAEHVYTHLEKPRPYPTPGGARVLGDSIHSLTPSTSLQERCKKFIDSLDPNYPEPPVFDEPYEYPATQPCEPGTIPSIKNGRNFPVPDERPAWMPDNLRIPPNVDHNYFAVPVKPEKRRRHKPRPRRDYDEVSSGHDECARRLYRLHT